MLPGVNDIQTYSYKDYLNLLLLFLYFTHQSGSTGALVIRDLSVSEILDHLSVHKRVPQAFHQDPLTIALHNDSDTFNLISEG